MKIEEGIYILNRDVDNPSPDRRKKREKMAQPVWSKGSRWVIEDEGHHNLHKDLSVGDIREKQPFAFYRVYPHGDFRGSGVRLDGEQGQALWVALEKQDETAGEILTKAGLLGPGSAMDRTLGTIFSFLIESGRVSLEDIKWAVEQYENEDGSDEEVEDLFWDRLKRNGFI